MHIPLFSVYASVLPRRRQHTLGIWATQTQIQKLTLLQDLDLPKLLKYMTLKYAVFCILITLIQKPMARGLCPAVFYLRITKIQKLALLQFFVFDLPKYKTCALCCIVYFYDLFI